jgi:hypothetical protein
MARNTSNEMDPRVGVIATHIVARLADAAIEDMRARYDFGRVLHMLRKSGRGASGAGALRRLAERLGVDPSALRRYAQVSEIISPREFAWMMRLTNKRGEPLTWSHVELLARERDPERRRELATAIGTESLAVRELAARVRGKR